MPHNARPNAICWCSKMRRKYAQKRRPSEMRWDLIGKSGRPDLNRGPPAPKAGAIPGYATPRRCAQVTIPGLPRATR